MKPTVALAIVLVLIAWAFTLHYMVWGKESAPKPSLPDVSRQYTVMVWDASCIEVLEKTEDTVIEATVNAKGEPDIDSVLIKHVHAEVNSSCGHYEVRAR